MNYSKTLLSDGQVTFHRIFVEITGSITAAIFLTKCLEESNKNSEWFSNSKIDWYEETGLTRSNLESSRKILADLGVIEKKRLGMPAKLFFKVNLDVLSALISSIKKRGA